MIAEVVVFSVFNYEQSVGFKLPVAAIINHLEENIKHNNEFNHRYFKLIQFQIKLEKKIWKISFSLFFLKKKLGEWVLYFNKHC